jgi:hypothetical protein
MDLGISAYLIQEMRSDKNGTTSMTLLDDVPNISSRQGVLENVSQIENEMYT